MRISALLLLLLSPLRAQDIPLDGKTLFTMNCAACHQPDRQVVGPSLVEIRRLYEKNRAGFIHWSKNPQQKRKGAVEMPSMAHIPDEQLSLIYDYILKAAKGLKEITSKDGDAYADALSATQRPTVLRLFMPDSGPASIAVAVDETFSYCWDAGPCRLRYIWKGDFLDAYPTWKGNGRGRGKIRGQRILTETQSPLASLQGTPKFLGYQMEDGLPTFTYRIGASTVTERIEAAAGSLKRHFTLQPAPAAAPQPVLADEQGTGWKVTPGEQPGSFTLTLVQP